MKTVYLDAISLLGPGLEGWQENLAVLCGERPYVEAPLPLLAPELLPRNERRRATGAIRLALRAGEDLLRRHSVDTQRLRAVFASSGGDSEIINSICLTLASPPRAVSPTQFHNSVHNAPAGYWAIATRCRMSSVSLSAYDGSFAAGLLEATTTAIAEHDPVLLVAYDYPPPAPLSAVRAFRAPFATAMLINAQASDCSLAALTLETAYAESEDITEDQNLERLRTGNPAARALPMLQTIARKSVRRVVLPYVSGVQIAVAVEPADSPCVT